jgi:hypothetical protein
VNRDTILYTEYMESSFKETARRKLYSLWRLKWNMNTHPELERTSVTDAKQIQSAGTLPIAAVS